jgi:hypothetical protein
MIFNKPGLASGTIPVVVMSLLVVASGCGGSSSSSNSSISRSTISAATPTFSLAAGTYSASQTVTILDTTAAVSISYCQDLTNSCTPSTPYMSALSITTTGFLRAQATASGIGASAVASASYVIGSSGGSGGGGGSYSTPSTTCNGSTGNCATLTVYAGPAGGYVNGAFTDVTVCIPGTSTCQTIDGVLVDTGSVGLRLLKSSVSGITLTQSKATSGDPLVECYPFVASYIWGSVAMADIKIAGETALSAPIMLIDDSSTMAFSVPASCSTYGGTPLPSANSLAELRANGILGIGSTMQDCGPSCTLPVSEQTDSSGQFIGLYYDCATHSNCTGTQASLTAQVPNPSTRFTDNNGTVISFPSVPATGSVTLTGALYFGIGTQSNNTMPSTATVLMLDTGYEQFITTTYKTTTNTHSYVDSGSNGYFFVDSSIPACTNTASNPFASDWFCPTGTLSLSATNAGASPGSSGSSTVSFSVASANTLFNNPDTAFSNLGGPGVSNTFDWGLPFFYGRVVYNAAEQEYVTNTSGTAFFGPFVAY